MRLDSDRRRFLVVLALLALCTAIGLTLSAFPTQRTPHHSTGRATASRVPAAVRTRPRFAPR
jgi:hypothetical protein